MLHWHRFIDHIAFGKDVESFWPSHPSHHQLHAGQAWQSELGLQLTDQRAASASESTRLGSSPACLAAKNNCLAAPGANSISPDFCPPGPNG